MYSTIGVDPAVSCNRNRPSSNEFPDYLGFSQANVCIYTQISLIVPNIQNPHRDTAEIVKLHELGMRLLPNPNKYGYCLLLPSTKYSKVCMVGAFLAYKIHFAPILPILQ